VSGPAEFLLGAVIGIGLLGILVPLLPGAPLVWLAILIWATEEQSRTGWVVLAVASVAIGVTQVARFVLPGRRMQAAGVPRRSMLLGAALGLIGFFVIPVLGLVLGFLLGIYLGERHRLGDRASAVASTRTTVRAVGTSVLIELTGGLLAAGAWVTAVLVL
jgi:hypothetical protein